MTFYGLHFYLYRYLLLHSLWTYGRVDAFSACDEIDITFVIDVDSIIADSDGVTKLITSVISSGSSEHSAFSAVIYGDNIPMDQKIKLISLHDTQSETQRSFANKKVADKLRTAFEHIASFNAAPKHRRILHELAAADPKPIALNEEDNEPDMESNDNILQDQDLRKWSSAEHQSSSSEPPQSAQSTSTSPSKSAERETRKRKKPQTVRVMVDDDKGTKSIGLLEAFKVAAGQSRPPHLSIRKQKLGYSPLDPAIGDHDDQQVYFIFDYHNKLLQEGDTKAICALFHHLDTNQIQNDDEAPLFMLGSKPSTAAIDSLFCDGKIPQYIKRDTFFHFSRKLINNDANMERVYSKTCPAEIKAPEYHGQINVGNHVQYLDSNTVIECKLYYKHTNDASVPPELDTKRSYLKVKDYINDDNTFTLNDHLLITPERRRKLKKRGCKESVMKILKISADDDKEYGLSDSDDSNDYKILKLTIQLPQNPMEYIQDADVHGFARKHRKRFGGNARRYDRRAEEQGTQDHAGKPRADPDEWTKTDSDELENVTQQKDESEEEEQSEELDQALEYEKLHRRKLEKQYSSAYAMMNDEDEFLDGFNYIKDIYHDDFVFDEVSILKGKMKDYADDDPLLESLSDFILSDRKRRMKHVFGKIVNLRKIAHRLVRHHRMKKKYRHSKLAPVFGAKALDFQNAYELQKQQAILSDFLGGLIPAIKVKADIKLLNIDIRKEWTVTKVDEEAQVTQTTEHHTMFGSWTETKAAELPEGWELSAFGDGELILRFGYIFRFIIGLKFEFKWIYYTPLVRIHFQVYIEWDIGAFFYVMMDKGKPGLRLDNILDFGKDLRFSIGPVPVLMRPYFKIFAEIESIGKPVHMGIKCRYNERIDLGYRISTFPGDWRGPIKKKQTFHKGCKKKLGIYQHIRDREQQCPEPAERIKGFDLRLSVQIGVILYKIVNIWLRFEFVIPIRVTVPEMNPRRCYLPSRVKDMCDIASGGHKTEWLKASFTFSLHLNLYFGIGLDLSQLLGLVADLLFGGGGAIGFNGWKIEKKIVTIPIIPTISMGCLDLRWHLEELDTAWRKSCCGFNGHKTYPPPKPIIGSPQFDDYWMEEYADENYGRYYVDDPYYDILGRNYENNDLRNPYYDDFYKLRKKGELVESSEDERESKKGFPNKHFPVP